MQDVTERQREILELFAEMPVTVSRRSLIATLDDEGRGPLVGFSVYRSHRDFNARVRLPELRESVRAMGGGRASASERLRAWLRGLTPEQLAALRAEQVRKLELWKSLPAMRRPSSRFRVVSDAKTERRRVLRAAQAQRRRDRMTDERRKAESAKAIARKAKRGR